jgi:hypothetical protein
MYIVGQHSEQEYCIVLMFYVHVTNNDVELHCEP